MSKEKEGRKDRKTWRKKDGFYKINVFFRDPKEYI